MKTKTKTEKLPPWERPLTPAEKRLKYGMLVKCYGKLWIVGEAIGDDELRLHIFRKYSRGCYESSSCIAFIRECTEVKVLTEREAVELSKMLLAMMKTIDSCHDAETRG